MVINADSLPGVTLSKVKRAPPQPNPQFLLAVLPPLVFCKTHAQRTSSQTKVSALGTLSLGSVIDHGVTGPQLDFCGDPAVTSPPE